MICRGCDAGFTPYTRTKDGYANSPYCHRCIYRRNLDKQPAYKMFKGRQQWAKKYGIPFTITLSDIETPTHCPVLGIELCYSNSKLQDNSPTLDKFIPELGYVPGNITTISQRANRIKSDANSEELRRVYEWMLSHTSS